jgi:peptide/nickel transport system substrate-binding protein
MNFNISIISIALSLLAFGCKTNPQGSEKKQSEKNGATFTMAETNEIGTLYPLAITSQVEGLITSQIHEGLVKLNPKTLEPIPGITEKWDLSKEGKLITFYLKKGVHFQDDKCYSDGIGPELTSKDIKYTFELLCTKAETNLQFESTLKDRLAGATEFYNKSVKAISGLKIIDDYTFSLELSRPSLSFLKLLANPTMAIVNETAVKAYGKDLKTGIGAFIYDVSSTKEKVVLIKNPNYYGTDSAGFSLPYLDTVVIKILPSIEEGLSLFENQQLDLINTLPSLRVKDVVEKNLAEFTSHPPKSLLQREPEMISQFYIFNTKQPPYDNQNIRKAINYAIDRDKLVDNVLKGQAIGPAVYGITPNTFKDYDITKINGYTLDVKKAKQLLTEGGFPGGIGFPEMKILINSGNSRNSSIAVEIQKQLKENLNINVIFEALPNVQKFDLQMHGKSDIYRDGWVADYASPESFLSLFVGDAVPKEMYVASFPNTSRYQNTNYDEYFKKGRDFSSKDSSYYYFMKAEQLLINEAVVIPLWYEGSYRLMTSKVKGLILNPMHYYDLTKVYKDKN